MTNTEQATPAARTTLARPWVVRMLIITVVLWAFGAWGFYDATVAYPHRGRMFAESQQLQYLSAARSAGRLHEAPIPDPRGELANLRQRDVLELSEFDRAKRKWLEALGVRGLGMLDPEHTRFDPVAELDRLAAYFDKNNAPAPLSAYDILMQWVICAVCWAIGTYLLLLFIIVKSRRYSWEAESRALSIPGGITIAPADLDPEEPADLSKWHKFIIFLRPRQGHEKLSGDIKLDLFRHHPLEDWIRELVKGAKADFEFPEDKKARDEAEQAANAEAESRGAGDGEAPEES